MKTTNYKVTIEKKTSPVREFGMWGGLELEPEKVENEKHVIPVHLDEESGTYLLCGMCRQNYYDTLEAALLQQIERRLGNRNWSPVVLFRLLDFEPTDQAPSREWEGAGMPVAEMTRFVESGGLDATPHRFVEGVAGSAYTGGR